MGRSRLLNGLLLAAALLLGARAAAPPFDGERPDPRAAAVPATGEGCQICLPPRVAPAPPAPREVRHLTIPGSESPHGMTDRCEACHAEGQAPTALNVDPKACLECHEAQAHRDQIHPTDFAGSSDVAPSFRDAPLGPDGRSTCLTCHGKACRVRRDNRPMLRGGPWPRQSDFCFRCPLPEDYAPVFPNEQRDANRLCWLCHEPQPQADGTFGYGARLELPQPELCLKCHKDVQHEREHVGRVLSESRLQPPPLETLAAFEARTGVRLPVNGDGTIRCSTCHDPSPACRANLENRGLQPKLLRAPKEQICYACHDL